MFKTIYLYAKTPKGSKIHLVERFGDNYRWVKFGCLPHGWYGDKNEYPSKDITIITDPDIDEICKTCRTMCYEGRVITLRVEELSDNRFLVLSFGKYHGKIFRKE